MLRRRFPAAVLLLATGLFLSGCAKEQSLGEASNDAARVEHVANSQLSRVTLSADAVARLGISTEQARAVPGSATATAVIPYAAVLYDAKGDTWVYKLVGRRTYVRQSITIDRVENGVAYLRKGLSPGTAVVAVGSAELFGAEYGVGGE